MRPYYEHAGITIYQADCLDILPGLTMADLLLTDPPYGIGESSRKNASRGKLARPIDYGDYSWDENPADPEAIQAAIKSADSSIIWGGNFFDLPPKRGWLVWDKLNGNNDFADCELAWTNLDISVRLFRHMWNGMLRASERHPRVHPTQKPIALMKWCLGFVPAASTVLDPFMGSGTTLVAAKGHGLQAVGVEISERYCEIAAKRLSQGTLPFDPRSPAEYQQGRLSMAGRAEEEDQTT